MLKPLFVITLFCAILQAQDITVSNDSVKLYSNPLSSAAYGVVFTSHTSAPIHLDSAYMLINGMDTTGLGSKVVEVSWLSNSGQFVWFIDTLSQNNRRLIKDVFYPPASQPLSFSATGATDEIFKVEIGFCFQCELFPKYVRYFEGTLKLYFSNGQTIALLLHSYDTQPPARTMPAEVKRYKGEGKKAPIFDLRGRFIGIAKNGLLPGHCRAGVYVFRSGAVEGNKIKIFTAKAQRTQRR